MEVRTGKNSVSKKYGFRRGGGLNHLRYDHKTRPTVIEVICPNCKQLAVASDTVSGTKNTFCADMSPGWEANSFDLVCTKCSYKTQGLSYFELPESFHQIYVFGEKLWAWNGRHLDMIRQSLLGADIREHAYAWLATYIHGAWKKKAKKFIAAIDAHLQMQCD